MIISITLNNTIFHTLYMMINLDDKQQIKNIDSHNMLSILYHLPDQIEETKKIIENVDLPKIFRVDNILICGMGGSAISGDILQSYLRRKLSIPMEVNRSYDLPKWVNKYTLVFSQSYSGDTEETLLAFKQAYEKHCQIIAVSSGGRLEEYCSNRGIPHIRIPSGYPPRAAIGYLLFSMLFALKKIGIFQYNIELDETIALLREVREEFNENVSIDKNIAKQLAIKIHGNIPQIYSLDIYEPIAKRWMNQFSENSKLISRYNVLPEATHNDIVAWSFDEKISKNFSCIFLRDSIEENNSMRLRIDFMKKILSSMVSNIEEVHPRGKKFLAKMMYLLYLGDYISCYLAFLRNVDPTPIDAITELKEILSKK